MRSIRVRRASCYRPPSTGFAKKIKEAGSLVFRLWIKREADRATDDTIRKNSLPLQQHFLHTQIAIEPLLQGNKRCDEALQFCRPRQVSSFQRIPLGTDSPDDFSTRHRAENPSAVRVKQGNAAAAFKDLQAGATCIANRDFVQGDPAAILLVEVRGKSEKELTENLAALQCKTSYARAELFGEDSDKVWKLRAAGLGLLSNVPGDAKPVACIEDTAVRIDVLQDYIREFDALMQDFGQESVYYAHAGAGELHLRPILNLKTSEGVRLLYEISKASA